MKREVRTDEIERIRALLATSDVAVPFDVARALLATLDAERAESARLRAKNRELNRRAQTAGSEARKDFVREWLAGGDHSATVRVARVLGIDTSGKSFATLADETEAAMRARLGEVERLRHALQVAHDWMGRAPDNDCDEGGGWGHAHLRTAEETVIAALSNNDCNGPGAP